MLNQASGPSLADTSRYLRSESLKHPSTEVLARYDRRAKLSGERISPFLREIHNLLLDYTRIRAWDRVLSVECADGWAAEELWRRLARGYVCGIDISPHMISLASKLRAVPGKLEFRVWDGESFPFAEESFDCVISTFGFHRYVNPEGVMREMARVLRPAGDAYILEPDRRSFGGLYALLDYYFRLADPGHLRYYSADQLLDLASQAGLPSVRVLKRYQRILRGGKLLATATVFHARRSGARTPPATLPEARL
jgi:ubiquinone/menaquinone biosynthesis C-methylase UbiE